MTPMHPSQHESCCFCSMPTERQPVSRCTASLMPATQQARLQSVEICSSHGFMLVPEQHCEGSALLQSAELTHWMTNI